MHCPRCGNQQDSDKTRFCTKCGLEMSNVKELLTSELSEAKEKKKRKIAKARKQGVIMIICGFGSILIFAGLREFYYMPKFIALIMLGLMFLGALRMSMPSLFGSGDLKEDETPEFKSEINELFGEEIFDKSLPEAEFRPPLEFETTKFNTNELVSPPSVTENTTKLLEKEIP